jgi:hypothetical protein
MLRLMVEKPTQMLGMLSGIWISICWQQSDNQKPVHPKSLCAFHRLFNKSGSIKEKFQKVNSQLYQSPGHMLETITVLYICGLCDCPHIHYTTICHLTTLMFIIPQCAIWLPSHSLYHCMPPDCLYVHYITLCCWSPICSSHHNMSDNPRAFTAPSNKRSKKYYK